MTEDLRISMIQSHIIWEDREENLGYYGELLRRVSRRTDLAVLPETFTTGFSMDVEKQADTMEGQTVPTIKEWAEKYYSYNNYHFALFEYENCLIMDKNCSYDYSSIVQELKSFINPEERIIKSCFERGGFCYSNGDHKQANKYFSKIMTLSNENSPEYRLAKSRIINV